MNYDTLDAIADSYIPLLLILFLTGFVKNLYQLWPNYRAPVLSLLYLISLLVITYGLMFFDNAARIWPAIGLDYSTHTAVALSLVFALCQAFPMLWKWFVLSMLAYAGLMLYQEYHSFLDICSTAIGLAGCALVIKRLFL